MQLLLFIFAQLYNTDKYIADTHKKRKLQKSNYSYTIYIKTIIVRSDQSSHKLSS